MSEKRILNLSSQDVSVTLDSSHSNKLKFTGTVMLLDEFSDYTPNGAEAGIYLSSEDAKESCESLNLMGINCVWSDWYPEDTMTGHDSRFKVGVVEKAYVEGNKLKIDGFVYQHDFPEIAYFIKNAVKSLGFSVEVLCDPVPYEDGYKLTNIEFTGVAMCYSNVAAYTKTCIDYLSAQRAVGEKAKMNEQEKQAMMKEMTEAIMASIKASQEENAKALEKEAKEKEMEAMVAELKAQAEAKDAEIADLKAKLVEATKGKEPEGVVLPTATQSKFSATSEEKPRNYGALISQFLATRQ